MAFFICGVLFVIGEIYTKIFWHLAKEDGQLYNQMIETERFYEKKY